MKFFQARSWTFGLWIGSVVLIGGILTSYHQPFLTPDEKILAIAKGDAGHDWREVHVFSGSCGHSQQVMERLLERGVHEGVTEQIVMLDGAESYLPASEELLSGLQKKGFSVSHADASEVAEDYGLHGTPLLLIATPDRRIVYLGGYGFSGDQDGMLLQEARAGGTPKRLPILGCALGKGLKRRTDPFGLKSASANIWAIAKRSLAMVAFDPGQSGERR